MSRKLSREFAMKLLYQLEIQKGDRDEQYITAIEECETGLSQKDSDYIHDVVYGVFSNLKEIDDDIEKNSKGWKLQRISRVDLSILRLCIYEIKFRSDIPLSVSINEAVELAKKYSVEDSSAFINGILSSVIPPVEKANKSKGVPRDE
ncbi:MAG: transcription antitermination factor NusB [Oscillospiraceae bacterium]|nr:transcription antitermination factor NusB [Oscillospiraceae bacterium]